MREWLVIENSMKNAVFAPNNTRRRSKKGYIPRDVAESLLGRNLGGNVWFSRKDSKLIQSHPEWSDFKPLSADETWKAMRDEIQG